MKVLVITNIPSPYRIPLFNELKQQLEAYNIELHVAFGSSSYSRRKFELNYNNIRFEYSILRSRTFHFGNNEKTIFSYSGLLKSVRKLKPDLIITNGFSIATLKIWLRSFCIKTNYLIWTGSIEKQGRNDSRIRELQRKLLMMRCSGYIVYGSKAREYLLHRGADNSKIFTAINTVDLSFFRNQTEELKAAMKSDHKKHLLFLGYLVSRKRVDKLLAAIRKLVDKRQDFILDIVGDGEDKSRLEKFVIENKIEPFVIFHGFQQPGKIPGYFSSSLCFLFQTDFDVWGLVLNEAMAAGLPCIVSPNAGAAVDLVKEGETGFVVNFEDTEKLIEKISLLLDNPARAVQMGNAASHYIYETASIAKSAGGFVQAILESLNLENQRMVSMA